MVAVALNAHAAEKIVEFSEPSFKQKGEFVEIKIKGSRYTTAERGAKIAGPQLPYKDIQFNVPEGTRLDEISVKISFKTEIKLDKKILPAKARKVIKEKTKNTLRDEKIYRSTRPCPARAFRILLIMEVCGEKIATVRIFPIQYFSVENKVIFHEKITINYPDFNQEELKIINTLSKQFLIISSQEIIESGALSSYISHREEEGYIIHLKTVENISQDYEGRDVPEKIRTYLQEYDSLFSGKKYVLFAGDNSIIPERNIPGSIPLGLNYPSEMYYFCLDGNWDENNNGIFGEYEDNVDITPNIFFGRISVDSAERLKNVLLSILSSEENYIKQFLGMGCDDHDNAGRIGVEKVLKYIPNNFTVRTYFEDETPKYAEQVISLINDDKVGYVYHVDHGRPTQISTGGNCITTSDIMELTNKKPVFINTAACFSANIFAENCVAESFFNNNSAIAYIGQSSFGLSPESDYQLAPRLYEIWFANPDLTLGQAYVQHIQLFLPEPNYAERFCILERMPLFDPTMKLRRNFCKGDFDFDGDVDENDLAVFFVDFGRTDYVTESPCEGDFDKDGDVDGSDLAVFSADFGRTNCD